MRMQSPASSGLLPASYSRRRRNRPNESIADGNGNSFSSGGGGGGSSYYGQNSYRGGGGGGGGDNPYNNQRNHSPTNRQRNYPSRKPPYALMSSSSSAYEDGGKSSDGENDENDPRRRNDTNASNHRRRGDGDGDDRDGYDDGYEDVLDKPPKLSDFAINDACYRRYLTEGKRSNYRGIGNRNNARRSSEGGGGIMDPAFLAKVGAGTSFVGMAFLVFVAFMMETQPLFIKGVSVRPPTGEGDAYRFRDETSNALKAAAAYFLTMVCCLMYLQTRDMNLEIANPAVVGRICHLRRLIVSTYCRYRRRHYDEIPDGDEEGLSLFVNSQRGGVNGSSSILPMHGGGGGGGGGGDKDKPHHRRRKRRSRRTMDGEVAGGKVGGAAGDAIGGMLGKIKGWGIGGGTSRTGRKKDR